MAESPVSFRLQRPDGPLPSQEDFGFGPDQTYAWKNFGNLTLSEAWERFIEFPRTYQEDFMFMGSAAFAYYFPVIDKYLREVRPDEFNDGCSAWILGCGVRSQFRWADGHKPSPQVVEEIRELSTFVRENTTRFSDDPAEQDRIRASWCEVDEEVAACRCQS
jgi:hypothetical protein